MQRIKYKYICIDGSNQLMLKRDSNLQSPTSVADVETLQRALTVSVQGYLL